MKFKIFYFLLFSTCLSFMQAQDLNITNALVVGQLDKPEDRFTLEVNLTEILAQNGVKTMASLNALKQGSSITLLATDSIQSILKEKGFDTYILVSVRGYDTKFKLSTSKNDLNEEFALGHLFPLYREEISSITFEFNFYRNGQFIGTDLLRLPSTSSRELVLKKLHKKLPQKINRWK